MQAHLVVGHFAADDQTGFLHRGKAAGDVGYLARVHKHALDLGGLIGATHPAFDAGRRAAAGTMAGQHRRQVSGAETDQGVVRVERGHHQLAHLTFGHGISRAGAHDLDNHAFLQHQAFAGGRFVGHQPQVSSRIGLEHVDAMFLEPGGQAGRAGFTAHRSLGDAADIHLGLLGFLQQDAQEAGCAGVGVGLQIADRVQLLFGLACPCREHGAAHSMGSRLQDECARGHVVAEAVVHQLAFSEASRVQRTAGAPVIGAGPFGFVDRAGAGEDARHGGPAQQG